jgi:hypothetical protein
MYQLKEIKFWILNSKNIHTELNCLLIEKRFWDRFIEKMSLIYLLKFNGENNSFENLHLNLEESKWKRMIFPFISMILRMQKYKDWFRKLIWHDENVMNYLLSYEYTNGKTSKIIMFIKAGNSINIRYFMMKIQFECKWIIFLRILG